MPEEYPENKQCPCCGAPWFEGQGSCPVCGFVPYYEIKENDDEQ